MSLHDLTTRTEAILKKYEKYDAPLGGKKGKADDPFQEEYDEIEAQIEQLMKEAQEIEQEKNRALVASRNADIRKAKQNLLSVSIESLQKKVKKGKNVTKQMVEARNQLVKQLMDKIYNIPDGMGGNRRPFKSPTPGSGPSGSKKDPIMIDSLHSKPQEGYFNSTSETQQFDREWEHAKRKQDAQLDRIEKGISTLGDMARGMQEELDKQNPVIDEIDLQMDKVTSRLKNNNMRLKGLVTQMRSSRNFCVDVVLICVLLAIAAYIYSMVKK